MPALRAETLTEAIEPAVSSSNSTSAEPAPESLESGLKSALRTTERAITRAAEAGRAVAFRLGAGGRPSVFVLPGATMNEASVDALNEGLAVMSRLLQKAAGVAPVDNRLSWGGVVGFGGRDLEAIYLEGFGAVFFLDVNLPLVPPAEVKKEKETETVDPDWEDAKREVREGRGGGGRSTVGWPLLFESKAAVYNEGRVEELKKALSQALKHASNLSSLGPSETVSVVVFGGPSPEVGIVGSGGTVTSRSGPRAFRFANGEMVADDPRSGPGTSGSVMTLRARKSDIDAFAKGQLAAADFAKLVQISVR